MCRVGERQPQGHQAAVGVSDNSGAFDPQSVQQRDNK